MKKEVGKHRISNCPFELFLFEVVMDIKDVDELVLQMPFLFMGCHFCRKQEYAQEVAFFSGSSFI